MSFKKDSLVKKSQRGCLYAILLSLILLLPVVEIQAASPNAPVAVNTVKGGNLTITIVKPLPNRFYFNDNNGMNISRNRSFVYGKITISALVTSAETKALIYVDFYAGNKLIANVTNASGNYYNTTWAPMILLNIQPTIKAVAHDGLGNNASATVNITKWRFHPLPFVIAAMAMMPSILPRTTIRGIVFNIQKAGMGYTFFAIYAHYRSTNLFKKESGSIILRRVRVGPVLSMHMFNISPLRLSRIESTFFGMIN